MLIHVDDLIKASFRVIGVLGKAELPSADEYEDALQTLNFMISSWSVRNLMVLGTILEGFSISAGVGSYTIGVGQTFNTTKPSAITVAYIRDSNGNDSSVFVTEPFTYYSFTDKAFATGIPTELFYDPGLTQQVTETGVIFLYPLPDKPYTLYIGQQKALTEFTAITDAVTFQPAYYEALKYELAIRLYREYHEHGKPIPVDIFALALQATKVLETLNTRQVIAANDIPGQYSTFNIYTGAEN